MKTPLRMSAAALLLACGPGGTGAETGSTGAATGTGTEGPPTTGGTGETGDCPQCAGTCTLQEGGTNPAWGLICGGPADEFLPRVAATGEGSLTVIFELAAGSVDPASLTLGDSVAHVGDSMVARLGPRGELAWSQVWNQARPWAAAGSPDGSFVASIGGGAETSVGGVKAGCGDSCDVIARLEANGSLAWHRKYRGSVQAFGLAIGPAGEVGVGGAFEGSTDLGVGPEQADDILEAFCVVYEPDGALRFARAYPGVGRASVAAVAFASDGSLAVGGSFDGMLDLGGMALTSDQGGAWAALLTSGGDPVWARHFVTAGSAGQAVVRTAVDPAGNVGVAGDFRGSINLGGEDLVNPDPGDFEDLRDDVFVASFDPGGAHRWSAQIGGEEHNTVVGLDATAAMGLEVTWVGESSGSRLDVFAADGAALASGELGVPQLYSAARGEAGDRMLAGSSVAPFELLGPWTPVDGEDVWVTRLAADG